MTLNGQAKVSTELDTFRRIRGFVRRFDEAQIEIDVDAIGVQSFQLATRSISKASLKPRGRRSKTWLALFEHDNLSVKKKSDGSSRFESFRSMRSEQRSRIFFNRKNLQLEKRIEVTRAIW